VSLYRACVELTLERLRLFEAQGDVCVDPPSAIPRVRQWLGDRWAYQGQRGHDLGERLAYATATAFSGGAQRVVVIGTDSPWLSDQDILAAFSAVDRSDVVIGPTDDGGYYLIGLSRPLPALFSAVSWSTRSVLRQTRSNARALGVRVELLRYGYDLDHPSDVERFIEEQRRHRIDAKWITRFVLVNQRRP